MAARKRITGKLMTSFEKKPACLLGEVTKVDPSSKKLTIKTTDGVFVQCVFESPIASPVEQHCLVEVVGVVRNANVFEATDYHQYYKEMSDKLDQELYNALCGELIGEGDAHFNVERPEDHEGQVMTAIDDFSLPFGGENGDITMTD